MNINEISAVIEALLFVNGNPMEISQIHKIIKEKSESEIKIKEIRDALLLLKEKYTAQTSGITIISTDDSYQLVTKENLKEYVNAVTLKKKQKNLTQASMETLSIIAYNQPVTRIMIEEIRGVKSDYSINALLEADLIEEAGRLDKIGRPLLYRTTRTFLLKFGLKTINDLPDIDRFKIDK